MERCLVRSKSKLDLEQKLKSAGFVLYRRGNTQGVKDIATGMKYRLKTLGLLAEYERSKIFWKNRPRMLKQIDRIRFAKQRDYCCQLGFRKDMENLLECGEKMPAYRKKVNRLLKRGRSARRK